MKAIRVHSFGGPDVLKLETIPDPTPAPGQVVVQNKAAGINPVDTYVRAGKYGPREFPYTPGTDAAGIVTAVGSGATQKVGDRVYLYCRAGGTYAEQVVCTSATVFALPANLSFAQGAAIGVPYSTAHRAHCSSRTGEGRRDSSHPRRQRRRRHGSDPVGAIARTHRLRDGR